VLVTFCRYYHFNADTIRYYKISGEVFLAKNHLTLAHKDGSYTRQRGHIRDVVLYSQKTYEFLVIIVRIVSTLSMDRVCIHNTSVSSSITNGPNTLVFQYSRLERLLRDKHTSLLGPFISYEGNEGILIRPKGSL